MTMHIEGDTRIPIRNIKHVIGIFHFHNVRVIRLTIGKSIQASLAFIFRKTFIFRWNFRLIQQ